MFSSHAKPALLVNLGGAHLPPIPLSVSARYQVCVDAGVMAAAEFFDDLAVVGLHDHMACSVSVFMDAARSSLAKVGDSSHERLRACVDAFSAGYLGRIHQELRLFHGEDVEFGQAVSVPSSPRHSTKIH